MNHEQIKIAMAVAVSKALGYKEEFEELNEILDPNWSEVYQKILPEIEQTKNRVIRMAQIAAISEAIKYSGENQTVGEKQILEHVMKKADEIIRNVEKFG